MTSGIPLAEQEDMTSRKGRDDINYTSLLRSRTRVNRPRPTLPPRTTIWVLTLLVFGAVFLILGISEYMTSMFSVGSGDSSLGLSMIVLGALMFTPGSYATMIVYGTYQGWSGYSYSQIPNYDED
jgi:hypothetical protein